MVPLFGPSRVDVPVTSIADHWRAVRIWEHVGVERAVEEIERVLAEP
jgi:hypothetical protein